MCVCEGICVYKSVDEENYKEKWRKGVKRRKKRSENKTKKKEAARELFMLAPNNDIHACHPF